MSIQNTSLVRFQAPIPPGRPSLHTGSTESPTGPVDHGVSAPVTTAETNPVGPAIISAPPTEVDVAVAAAAVPGPVGVRLSDIEAPLTQPVSQYDNTAKRAMEAGKLIEGVAMAGTDTPSIIDLGGTTHFTWIEPPLDWHLGDPADIVARTAAANRGTPTIPIVEVPDWARSTSELGTANLKKLMDAGALGMAAPGIRDAEQARQFIQGIKYPPDGIRGVGPAFSTHFLRPGNVAQAVNQANAAMLGIIVVDNSDAVRNIDSIAAVPGVDVLYVDNKLDASARAQVEAAARAHGLALGAQVGTREEALDLYGKGYRMVTVGRDLDFIRDGIQGFFQGGSARDTSWEAAPRIATGSYDNPLRDNLVADRMSYGYYKMGTSLTDAPLYRDVMNFDWQDSEHMTRTPVDVAQTTAVKEGHAAVSTVRVPRWDAGARPGEIALHEYLDAGAKALICPQIEAPEQARSFLNALRFKTEATPDGTRPLTDAFRKQAAEAGLTVPQAMQKANDSTTAGLMIETTKGLANREAIMQVLHDANAQAPGSAWLHIGPYDLRLSLSRNDSFRSAAPAEQDKQFNAAVASIEATARAAHVPLGGLALSRTQAHDMFNRGYRVLTVASDQEGINNSAVMQDFAIFPPTDRAATLAGKDQLLARFKDVPWQTLPDGRRQQVVSDAQGTYVHLLAPASQGPTGTFSHPSAQQTTLLAGETRVKVGTQPERKLEAGETVVIGPGINHTFANLTPTEVIDSYYPPRTDL